jgi:pseudouridine-5'-phosphate glycosidase/pseudouridine kinase
LFSISDEVRHALKTHMPVVALETTIYTHGFPYPDNLALASHLESVVRLNGAIPATIGILNGGIKIGMTPEELTELVSSAGKTDMMKVSIRDLPYIAGLVSIPTFVKSQPLTFPRA